MLFSGTIRKGVMKVIERRIQEAQKVHDEEVIRLEKEKEEKIKESEFNQIKSIIGNFI